MYFGSFREAVEEALDVSTTAGLGGVVCAPEACDGPALFADGCGAAGFKADSSRTGDALDATLAVASGSELGLDSREAG